MVMKTQSTVVPGDESEDSEYWSDDSFYSDDSDGGDAAAAATTTTAEAPVPEAVAASLALPEQHPRDRLHDACGYNTGDIVRIQSLYRGRRDRARASQLVDERWRRASMTARERDMVEAADRARLASETDAHEQYVKDVTLVQSLYRRQRDRRRFEIMCAQRSLHRDARRIQALYRGRRDRNRVRVLLAEARERERLAIENAVYEPVRVQLTTRRKDDDGPKRIETMSLRERRRSDNAALDDDARALRQAEQYAAHCREQAVESERLRRRAAKRQARRQQKERLAITGGRPYGANARKRIQEGGAITVLARLVAPEQPGFALGVSEVRSDGQPGPFNKELNTSQAQRINQRHRWLAGKRDAEAFEANQNHVLRDGDNLNRYEGGGGGDDGPRLLSQSLRGERAGGNDNGGGDDGLSQSARLAREDDGDGEERRRQRRRRRTVDWYVWKKTVANAPQSRQLAKALAELQRFEAPASDSQAFDDASADTQAFLLREVDANLEKALWCMDQLWEQLSVPEKRRALIRSRVLLDGATAVRANYERVYAHVTFLSTCRDHVHSVLEGIRAREQCLRAIEHSAGGADAGELLAELRQCNDGVLAAIDEWRLSFPWMRAFAYDGQTDYTAVVHRDEREARDAWDQVETARETGE
jgi:hypothetical protein